MTLNKNPLFPDNEQPADPQPKPGGFLLPGKTGRIEPLNNKQAAESETTNGANPAVKLIKEKLARLYNDAEPDAKRESQVAETAAVRSPHQQYMHELTTSGLSLAEIQTRWHQYYTNLPDDQKHQVWQEFYDANSRGSFYEPTGPQAPATKKEQPKAAKQPKKHDNGAVVADHGPVVDEPSDNRKPAAIRSAIRERVQRRASKLSAKQKQNLHSLMFGLGTGLVVLLIVMFGFFNQVIIAPFIQPGRANATPIIIDNNSIAADGQTKVIIPKINVQIPVVYDLPSSQESVIQKNLEDGVVHYPSTERPGQDGNVAIFGHSSNNIFNKGSYKFAFVLLHELQTGDKFYLTYEGKVYAYKVITKKVVDPSQVEVLNDVPGEKATATLITCDPPGTTLHRLVVVGEQISPNPANNSKGNNNVVQDSGTQQLAGDGPSLWSRFWNWLF